ncbi:hypothetical protein CVT26_001896 [Gymnopilus dilepis]|uniref:Nephrocystin 3-like N-terminal domain-containing protein n=1 Tax=Gymnopilus dilepis TaxID=231916 RepID=A0A409Y3T7_9AGAR|nr:hypothetical protein CVT26_001896 [Gymnopilus dilepis]
MAVYSNSNVTVTGGSSTYVAGNSNYFVEVHEQRGTTVAFERLLQFVAGNALHNSWELSDEPICHPGTRRNILDDLLAWSASLTYKHPMRWLHGPAGAGKSAIMRTIAQLLCQESLLLASFFFRRKCERRDTSTHLIATIAYQVAIGIPEARPYIEGAIDRNPFIFALSLWDQALELIVSPLISVSNNPSFRLRRYPPLIVIDGLDECHAANKQLEVIRVLHRIIRSVPIPLAVLIASRPDHDIQAEFNTSEFNMRSLDLSLDDGYNPDSDIRSYLVDTFARICHYMKTDLPSPWPASDAIDKLVAKASGQFIYATTVSKFISSPKHNPEKRLNIILGLESDQSSKPFEEIDNLYSSIFGTIANSQLSITLRILGILLVPYFEKNPDPEDQKSMENLSLMPFDDTRSPGFVEDLLRLDRGDVRTLLFDLGSLLVVEERNKNVRISHASLSDYLFDKSRSLRFWIDVELVYADLAEHCTRRLSEWAGKPPGIRSFFVWNSSLFFSKAAPTFALQTAIQELNFEELIYRSSDMDPHGLRDICPTFLQALMNESRFLDAKNLFSDQLDDFITIVTGRLHVVYFPSARLMTFIISSTLIPATRICELAELPCFIFSRRERELERVEGFSLSNARRPPPIMPYIRSLLNDTKSGCFIDSKQYAEAAFNILKSFFSTGLFYIPQSLSKLLKDLVPSLLDRSANHSGLTECAKKLIILWKDDVKSNVDKYDVEQICKALEYYVSKPTPSPQSLGAKDHPDKQENVILATSQPELEQNSNPRKRSRAGPHGLELIRRGSPTLCRPIKRTRKMWQESIPKRYPV